MEKPETRFRKKVRSDLDKLIKAGFPLFYEPIQQKTIKGSPDFFLSVNGQFMGLELKSIGGKLSPLQEVKLSQIDRSGGMGLVANPTNWNDVLKTITFFLENDDD